MNFRDDLPFLESPRGYEPYTRFQALDQDGRYDAVATAALVEAARSADSEAWDSAGQDSLTDVEILFNRVSAKLNADEAKRTGKAVDPNGAVPVASAIAASTMLYSGWSYPSEADLSVGVNPAILAAIYADPTTNTTAESSVDQKRSALHFTLVMLAGQTFGLDYQDELGAYERTASGQFLTKMDEDQSRDWLDLPCPKMHKDWPEFATVRAMFRAVMA